MMKLCRKGATGLHFENVITVTSAEFAQERGFLFKVEVERVSHKIKINTLKLK